MKIEPFEMERWQSTWEHKVDFNLSESGVHPLTVRELLEMPGDGPILTTDDLLATGLGYAQGNGIESLRERISLIYPGSTIENILVTHGGAEANFLATLELIKPGEEVVIMLPNYMQVWGLVQGWGAEVKPWLMREENDWQPDPEELRGLVSEKTKLIVITNPNNPTGKVFRKPLLEAIVAAASKVGAWILADEIYRGAENAGEETPGFWGMYDRLLITSGLSKAYGLPGLRIGWVASPDVNRIDTLWSYHDYSTICSSPLTEALATHALEPVRRQNILERTRGIIRNNLPLLLEWIDGEEGLFSHTKTEAGAIMWVRYHLEVDSLELAERVRVEKSALIEPGDHFGVDHYLRLGFGPEHSYLTEALERVREVLVSYRKEGR